MMTCLFRFITGIPCPACGVTRALLSLLRLDFDSYVHYNAFAVPLVLAVIYMWAGTRFKVKSLQIAAAVVVFLNVPYYIYRFYNGLIP